MFETTFQQASATPLPLNVSIEQAIALLHDFETVIKLSPDCRGCKLIQPKSEEPNSDTQAETQHYEVEDDLPFIPKSLWSGGVKYTADFTPTPDGCVITVHAPGGFTSINNWIVFRRETKPEDETPQSERVQAKDTSHAETGEGWCVQIVSDATCNWSFAVFVKGFLKGSHQQQQRNFIEKLQATPAQ